MVFGLNLLFSKTGDKGIACFPKRHLVEMIYTKTDHVGVQKNR